MAIVTSMANVSTGQADGPGTPYQVKAPPSLISKLTGRSPPPLNPGIRARFESGVGQSTSSPLPSQPPPPPLLIELPPPLLDQPRIAGAASAATATVSPKQPIPVRACSLPSPDPKPTPPRRTCSPERLPFPPPPLLPPPSLLPPFPTQRTRHSSGFDPNATSRLLPDPELDQDPQAPSTGVGTWTGEPPNPTPMLQGHNCETMSLSITSQSSSRRARHVESSLQWRASPAPPTPSPSKTLLRRLESLILQGASLGYPPANTAQLGANHTPPTAAAAAAAAHSPQLLPTPCTHAHQATPTRLHMDSGEQGWAAACADTSPLTVQGAGQLQPSFLPPTPLRGSTGVHYTGAHPRASGLPLLVPTGTQRSSSCTQVGVVEECPSPLRCHALPHGPHTSMDYPGFETASPQNPTPPFSPTWSEVEGTRQEPDSVRRRRVSPTRFPSLELDAQGPVRGRTSLELDARGNQCINLRVQGTGGLGLQGAVQGTGGLGFQGAVQGPGGLGGAADMSTAPGLVQGLTSSAGMMMMVARAGSCSPTPMSFTSLPPGTGSLDGLRSPFQAWCLQQSGGKEGQGGVLAAAASTTAGPDLDGPIKSLVVVACGPPSPDNTSRTSKTTATTKPHMRAPRVFQTHRSLAPAPALAGTPDVGLVCRAISGQVLPQVRPQPGLVSAPRTASSHDCLLPALA